MGKWARFLLGIVTAALVFLGQASVCGASDSEDRPYLGLPQCIDFSYRSDPTYLPYIFVNQAHTFMVPISEDTVVTRDGTALDDGSSEESEIIEASFPARHYVYVPESGRIKRLRDHDRIDWIFPEGSTFIHEIYLDPKATGADFSDLIEVRVERMIGGTFHYGVYDKAGMGCPTGSLTLRTKPIPQLTRISEPRSASGNVSIAYHPLSPSSCLECHDLEDVAVKMVQPCAFEDVTNSAFMTIHADIPRWTETYRKKFGHSPFAGKK